MRILWITNIMFPPLCKHLNLPTPVIGGWMYSSAKRLLEVESSLQLAVATVYRGYQLQKHEIEGVTYYLLPLRGKRITDYPKHMESLWRKVAQDYHPDLVHLHGSEFPFGLAFVKANPKGKVVVSLQGIVSVIDRYYTGNMSFGDILRNITFRDLIKWDTIWQQKRDFTRRGKYEKEVIRLVRNVIGRTSWDKSHAYSIAPNANYYFCNETLRDEFYKYSWSYDQCEKHTIFLSQAGYPVKGLHKVLMALPLIIHRYPDLKVYIAGHDPRSVQSFIGRIKRGGYGQYILRLIKILGVEKLIHFTGPLNEQEMCKQYLKANVFVCPSSIENSPNSLGEAQLLGVPCIASYVGGIPDMMEGYHRGAMYRFEEIEMLAEKICKVFAKESFDEASGIEIAHQRHHKMTNAKRTIEIYKKLVIKNL